ncbi:MAG: hypothetical protein QOD46_122, partial [Actinomycetota bacterium]|nr:hypothetical protein [Actinomycetota bacterium]
MLPAPASPQVAAASGLLVALLFLAVGYLIVDGITAARHLPSVIRLGLAFPGALALVLVLLGVHVVTGGRVFSEPWVTRGLVAAFAVG